MGNLSCVARRSRSAGALLFQVALLVPARMASQGDFGSDSGLVRDLRCIAITGANNPSNFKRINSTRNGQSIQREILFALEVH
jgi:hypothetical protein